VLGGAGFVILFVALVDDVASFKRSVLPISVAFFVTLEQTTFYFLVGGSGIDGYRGGVTTYSKEVLSDWVKGFRGLPNP
jgi:hypothetical protein